MPLKALGVYLYNQLRLWKGSRTGGCNSYISSKRESERPTMEEPYAEGHRPVL